MKFYDIEIRPKRTEFDEWRIIPCGTCSDLLSPHEDEEDGHPIMLVSQSLYDAIPRVDIDLNGVPTPEQLAYEDDILAEWGMENGKVTYVYFLISGLNGLIKIGYTSSPDRRMADYKTHTPENFDLHLMPGNKNLDRLLRDRCEKLRYSTEWFFPHPQLLDYISGIG